MPRVLFLLLLLGTSVGMTRSEPIQQARNESTTRVVAMQVPLDPEGGHRRVGALVYVSGYVLESADPRFGGISAMARTPQGFVALSDSGTVMWINAARGRPTSVRLLPLPAGPGTGAKKSDRDSEALVRDERGRIWVAYEHHNSIWRYGPDLHHAEANRAPADMRRWPANSGPEAMVRLDDGRFIVFSEDVRRDGTSDVLLFDRDPTDPRSRAERLSYRLPRGFSVTDAALLGAGRIVTLHRSASISDGLVASVGIADLGAIRAGAVVAPRIVSTLHPPLTVDNMEALAVERVGGRTRLWIASDDNFSALQRTLLLQFQLDERAR